MGDPAHPITVIMILTHLSMHVVFHNLYQIKVQSVKMMNMTGLLQYHCHAKRYQQNYSKKDYIYEQNGVITPKKV